MKHGSLITGLIFTAVAPLAAQDVKVTFEIPGLKSEACRKLETGLKGLAEVKQCVVSGGHVVVLLAEEKEFRYSALRKILDSIDAPRDGYAGLIVKFEKTNVESKIQLILDGIDQKKALNALQSVAGIQTVTPQQGDLYEVSVKKFSATVTVQALMNALVKAGGKAGECIKDLVWTGPPRSATKSARTNGANLPVQPAPTGGGGPGGGSPPKTGGR